MAENPSPISTQLSQQSDRLVQGAISQQRSSPAWPTQSAYMENLLTPSDPFQSGMYSSYDAKLHQDSFIQAFNMAERMEQHAAREADQNFYINLAATGAGVAASLGPWSMLGSAGAYFGVKEGMKAGARALGWLDQEPLFTHEDQIRSTIAGSVHRLAYESDTAYSRLGGERGISRGTAQDWGEELFDFMQDKGLHGAEMGRISAVMSSTDALRGVADDDKLDRIKDFIDKITTFVEETNLSFERAGQVLEATQGFGARGVPFGQAQDIVQSTRVAAQLTGIPGETLLPAAAQIAGGMWQGSGMDYTGGVETVLGQFSTAHQASTFAPNAAIWNQAGGWEAVAQTYSGLGSGLLKNRSFVGALGAGGADAYTALRSGTEIPESATSAFNDMSQEEQLLALGTGQRTLLQNPGLLSNYALSSTIAGYEERDIYNPEAQARQLAIDLSGDPTGMTGYSTAEALIQTGRTEHDTGRQLQQFFAGRAGIASEDRLRAREELQGAFIAIQSYQGTDYITSLDAMYEEGGIGAILNYGVQQQRAGTGYGAVSEYPTIDVRRAMEMYGALSPENREGYIEQFNNALGAIEGGARLREITGVGGWRSGDARLTNVEARNGEMVGTIEANGREIGTFTGEGIQFTEEEYGRFIDPEGTYYLGGGISLDTSGWEARPVAPLGATAFGTVFQNWQSLRSPEAEAPPDGAFATGRDWAVISALRGQGTVLASTLRTEGPGLVSSQQDMAFATNQMQQSELENATQIMSGSGPNAQAWDEFNEKFNNNRTAWEDALASVGGGTPDSSDPNQRRLVIEEFASKVYDGKNWAALDETEKRAVQYWAALRQPRWGIQSDAAIEMAAQDVGDAAGNLYNRANEHVPRMSAEDIRLMERDIQGQGFTAEGGGLIGQYEALARHKGQLEGDLETATGDARTAIQDQISEADRAISDIGSTIIQAPGFDDGVAVSVAVETAQGRALANAYRGGQLAMSGRSEAYSTALASLQEYLGEQGLSSELSGKLVSGRITQEEVATVTNTLGLNADTRIGGAIIGDLEDGYLHDLQSILEHADIDLANARVPGEETEEESGIRGIISRALQSGDGSSPENATWVRIADDTLIEAMRGLSRFSSLLSPSSGGDEVESPGGDAV